MELAQNERFESDDFSLRLYDRFADMREAVFPMEEDGGLSRLVAGFSWEYKTKKNRHLYDMTIEGINLRWNSVAKDWINSKNAINEVGSIHTVFGNDLNYIAIVLGNEIDYDPVSKSVIITLTTSIRICALTHSIFSLFCIEYLQNEAIRTCQKEK